MFNIFAKSFMTAARTDRTARWHAQAQWQSGRRFDERRHAELEAHTTARRRD